GLFGLSNIPPDATEIILTGREIDAMAVYQATGLPTVSVSTVTPQLTPEIIPLLDQFSKINIWFSDDAVGQEYAHQVAQKLGVDRCHIIRSSSNSNSNSNTNTNMIGNLKTPLDEAQPLEHEQILRFDSFRDVIQRELANPSQTAGIQSSSFPGLNLLLKGHRRGELTIVSGATGVGKTTILSQLSLDYCSQGVSTLWGSFEIQNKRLAKRMLIQHAKLDLTTDLDQFDNYANQFSRLPLFFLRFFGSTPANEVVNAITHSVDAYDVKHVIIDNLQFMLSGQGRNLDKWDIQDDAIAKLRKLATEKDIHVTLVVHPRKSQDANEPLDIHSVFGSAKVTQEADNVIFIQRYPHQRQFGDRASGANGDDDALNPRAHLRYLDVHKNRFDGTLGKVFLSFNPKTYLASEVSRSEIKQLASTSASSSSSSSASR
ncbi:P-loop containing nucleoside triphosphate hydrolase protein, partial [Ramicandelaber brevisporus]